MVAGHFSIGIAFIATLVSTYAYGQYYKKHSDSQLKFANRSYYVTFGSITFAAILLLSQILTHNFQLNYVYSYSSRILPTFYLISTFWAGQEGTLLLWLLISALFGIFLIKKHAAKNPLVMVFLLLSNLFLLILLIKKSPFAMIWDVHKEAAYGIFPADGSGLNPLLQNPWMVIHPPTLFVGYAATVVPFAFALSAMIRKDYQNWINDARIWVIFTVFSLGLGIILGAYWAYTTLGWGGYWGWDPVENSSLIPWLLAIALIHSLAIQKRQKGLVRTNLFLAGLSFIIMIWGSFLTRSGVLTDFSVHSFGESGLNIYFITFIVLSFGAFLYFYSKTAKSIKSAKFTEGIFSRETFTFIGILAVLFSAIFTFIGTSSPIFTGLIGKPASVSVNYYNTIHIPITVFLLLTAALAPILAWKVSEFRNLSTVLKSAIGSLLVTVVAVFLGLTQPVSIVIFCLSVFVIVMNFYVLYTLLRSSSTNIGGPITHIGLGLMLIGILTSSVYDSSEKIMLPKGEFQVTDLGYELKFLGFREMPDGKDRVQLEIKIDEKTFPAEAQFYYSNFTNSHMVSPYIKLELLKDIYISPTSYTPAEQGNLVEIILKKGETKRVRQMDITFHNFEMGGDHVDTNVSMVVTADLTITGTGEDKQSYKLKPEYIVKDGAFITPELQIPNKNVFIKIGSINASEGAIQLRIITDDEDQTQSVDMLGVEISKKPLIIILWFGCIVLLFGIFMSLYYRNKTVAGEK